MVLLKTLGRKTGAGSGARCVGRKDCRDPQMTERILGSDYPFSAILQGSANTRPIVLLPRSLDCRSSTAISSLLSLYLITGKVPCSQISGSRRMGTWAQSDSISFMISSATALHCQFWGSVQGPLAEVFLLLYNVTSPEMC